ncbi:LLM class flavin-dependent oxidoreductase [Nocardia miyunensis]|uniref:LLM class flavin-dependent oxidoreductase n=1 Tax=Nocardia miyunensis TaxID=282684 RepID=UPI000A05DD66
MRRAGKIHRQTRHPPILDTRTSRHARVASSAPAVIIDRVGSVTQHVRVGAGGVMAPNHSPIVVAEQFGTLEAFHRGRVDLGLGRASGGPRDVIDRIRSPHDRESMPFEDQIRELLALFEKQHPNERAAAVSDRGQPPRNLDARKQRLHSPVSPAPSDFRSRWPTTSSRPNTTATQSDWEHSCSETHPSSGYSGVPTVSRFGSVVATRGSFGPTSWGATAAAARQTHTPS